MDSIHSSSEQAKNIRKPVKSRKGLILVGVTGSVAVGLSIVSAPFVLPAFRRFCLPYIPATSAQVRNVFTALERRKGSLIDLGSGDGRICSLIAFPSVLSLQVIAGAKKGFQATGIELNSLLVLYSMISARLAGVSHQCHFKKADLWKTNLGLYDNVVIFGVAQMMGTLGQKMEKELKKGSCIAACRFPVPEWYPVRTVGEGVDTVWLYQVPQSYSDKTFIKQVER
ncbi:Protein N-lysine methyltransferase FAM173B [Holothuria leucospilota]|uniref:Protein N-lysine methyltransferase FAM173B n=1 Tax=Holothuria leucospilota TaxID=206669 RepID=A0A9Q1BVD8_HOLLE|nr:Protein N-lysine methyltransferase FAM173B [Holothuria leucospilota]